MWRASYAQWQLTLRISNLTLCLSPIFKRVTETERFVLRSRCPGKRAIFLRQSFIVFLCTQPHWGLELIHFLRTPRGSWCDSRASLQIDGITDERWSYAQLLELSSRVAAGLQKLGFRPGQLAGLHCDATPDIVVAFYGTVLAGGSMVFAKSSLTESEYSVFRTRRLHVFKGDSFCRHSMGHISLNKSVSKMHDSIDSFWGALWIRNKGRTP